MCPNQSENRSYLEAVDIRGRGDAFSHHLPHEGEIIVVRSRMMDVNLVTSFNTFFNFCLKIRSRIFSPGPWIGG